MQGHRYYLNRKNIADGFAESIKGSIFVDKSLLIDFINTKLSTKEKWICISRPRRFGKTMALEMLAAYYTKGAYADNLFDGLKIKSTLNYYKHLNCHNTIYMNFNDLFEKCSHVNDALQELNHHLLHDLNAAYPGLLAESLKSDYHKLPLAFDIIQQETGQKFIFLIDEWDCIFRFHKGKKTEQAEFLSFLKQLFKDKTYVELVYMTGILPIKKYNTGSALNMFREYTVLEPKKLGSYYGFTEPEIESLCLTHPSITINELRQWYNGYHLEGTGNIYNPRSVVEALEEGCCRDYWNRTGGFTELEEYIKLDFDGLGEAVTNLLSGDSISVNVLGFSNDLDSFKDKDEVITALIHLGYLTYDNGKVRIPNREIFEEFGNTVKKLSWGVVSQLLNQSRQLLQDTLSMNEAAVSKALEHVHDNMQEFKEYNNEHTLKCVIHLAYYAAMDQYELFFEQPAGKGVADCRMIPRRPGIPGLVLELKYNSSAESAIEQILKKDYISRFPEYVHQVLCVGINYNKTTKVHECRIVKKAI